jgi:hypothetical protein
VKLLVQDLVEDVVIILLGYQVLTAHLLFLKNIVVLLEDHGLKEHHAQDL